MSEQSLSAARHGDEGAFRDLVAPYQRELRAYCYRMSGSTDDADDLMQECMLRAWRGLDSFEGRSSLRTWLYRVAWSVSVDALEKKKSRALVVDVGPAADPDTPPPAPTDGWIGPCPASFYADAPESPEARYTARESVALAFLAALQLLPPKQRAVLISRDVLGWSAEECAEAFGGSVAAMNSALQRARETLDARATKWRPKLPDDEGTRRVLAKYIDAWERSEVGSLVELLHEEATLSMPPLPMWLLGRDAIVRSLGGMVMTPATRGTIRFVPSEANGLPALAAYRRRPTGRFELESLHMLSLDGERIDAMIAFLDPRLLGAFDLPAHVE